MHVLFKSPNAVINDYSKKLKIDFADLESTIIKLRLKDAIPARGIAILNRLIEIYNTKTVEEQNALTENSLAFIDNRLDNVRQEITTIERNIENYKKANKISSEANANIDIVMHDISKYTETENEISLQLGVMKSMLDLMNTPNKFELIPDNMGIDNFTLSTAINNYNDLILTRQQLLRTAQPSNPLAVVNQEKLVSLQALIKKNIYQLTREAQKKLKKVEGLNKNLTGKLERVPIQERGLLVIRRQYDVKEQLYSFLLQKREETALSLITTMPNSRIIDAPRYKQQPISPVKSLVYMGGLIIGLIQSDSQPQSIGCCDPYRFSDCRKI